MVQRFSDSSVPQSIMDRFAHMEKRIEYDVSDNPIYVGYAAPGSASSAAAWFITKQTFDGNDNMTRQQMANDKPSFDQVYDDRASLF